MKLCAAKSSFDDNSNRPPSAVDTLVVPPASENISPTDVASPINDVIPAIAAIAKGIPTPNGIAANAVSYTHLTLPTSDLV